jgi:hypothetical protein
MLEELLNPDAAEAPVPRRATHVDGAWSILVGIATNASLERGQTVSVARLLEDARLRL